MTSKGEIKIVAQKKSIKELRGILHKKGQEPKSIEEMNKGIEQYLKEKHKK